MEKYEVFKSEGGYRVAKDIINGGAIIKNCPWYANKKTATAAAVAMWHNDDSAAVYVVCNVYGIRGTSRHMTAEAAIRERNRREGEGWIVEDGEGNRLDMPALIEKI